MGFCYREPLFFDAPKLFLRQLPLWIVKFLTNLNTGEKKTQFFWYIDLKFGHRMCVCVSKNVYEKK